MVRQECMATIGAVSNPDNSNQNYGKAGRMRHKGIRPSVRVLLNPIDHPHGGGEGRTSGGRHPVTPWGTYQRKAYKKYKQSVAETNYSLAARKEERALIDVTFIMEGTLCRCSVLKKAEAARESGRNDVIKIWSRRSTILPQFVGLTLAFITVESIFRFLFLKI